MKTWCTKELATYAVETKIEDYPEEVTKKAKVLILVSIGCMFGGTQTSLGRAIMKPILDMGGSEESTIVDGGVEVPTIQAAGSMRRWIALPQ